MKSLTIITVCYNAANTLERCLKSIASQRFSKFNHIVVDGESDDDTVRILDAFGYRQYCDEVASSGEGRMFLSEPDEGVYFAMNKGIERTSTSHCLFLNADDYLFDDFATERIISNIETNRMSVFAIQYTEGSMTRKFCPVNVTDTDILYDKSLRRCPHPSSVFPVSEIRFDTQYRYAADYQFVLKNISKYGCAKTSGGLVSAMCRSRQQLSHIGRDEMKAETELISQRYDGRAKLTPNLFYWVLKNLLSIAKKYLWKLRINGFSNKNI